jgi:Cytochrome b
MTAKPEPRRLLIWDLPLRLFHWALALLFGVMWWTGEERMLDLHRAAGYSVIALLLFRIVWGFAGSSTARFGNFVRSPRSVGNYVRNEMLLRGGARKAGHNPLGGWSVLVMLALLLIQCLLGLFAVDIDGLESGPFSYLVEFDTGRVAAELHHIIFDALVVIVALHILAVIFYLVWRRQNLVLPMISGHSPSISEDAGVTARSFGFGFAILAGCGLAVFAVVELFGRA